MQPDHSISSDSFILPHQAPLLMAPVAPEVTMYQRAINLSQIGACAFAVGYSAMRLLDLAPESELRQEIVYGIAAPCAAIAVWVSVLMALLVLLLYKSPMFRSYFTTREYIIAMRQYYSSGLLDEEKLNEERRVAKQRLNQLASQIKGTPLARGHRPSSRLEQLYQEAHDEQVSVLQRTDKLQAVATQYAGSEDVLEEDLKKATRFVMRWLFDFVAISSFALLSFMLAAILWCQIRPDVLDPAAGGVVDSLSFGLDVLARGMFFDVIEHMGWSLSPHHATMNSLFFNGYVLMFRVFAGFVFAAILIQLLWIRLERPKGTKKSRRT